MKKAPIGKFWVLHHDCFKISYLIKNKNELHNINLGAYNFISVHIKPEPICANELMERKEWNSKSQRSKSTSTCGNTNIQMITRLVQPGLPHCPHRTLTDHQDSPSGERLLTILARNETRGPPRAWRPSSPRQAGPASITEGLCASNQGSDESPHRKTRSQI